MAVAVILKILFTNKKNPLSNHLKVEGSKKDIATIFQKNI